MTAKVILEFRKASSKSMINYPYCISHNSDFFFNLSLCSGLMYRNIAKVAETDETLDIAFISHENTFFFHL